jgi:hypothetical protein
MEALRRDPRLRLVPLAARALWLLLADALAQMPEPGVFRLGLRVGSVREVSLLVSAEETEIETHLETLLETGLVTREADGALSVPLPATGSRRTVAAQGNGRLGGRPRRGETAEQARLRRAQTSLMMPISGGVAETQETHGETHLAGAAAAAREEKESKQPREETQVSLDALGAELAEIAGLDPVRGTYDYRPVMDWRGQGISDALLRQVVAEVAARPGYRPPQTLGYFRRPVADAVAAGRMAARPLATTRPEITAYLAAVEAWERGGRDGRAPVHPDHRSAA